PARAADASPPAARGGTAAPARAGGRRGAARLARARRGTRPIGELRALRDVAVRTRPADLLVLLVGVDDRSRDGAPNDARRHEHEHDAHGIRIYASALARAMPVVAALLRPAAAAAATERARHAHRPGVVADLDRERERRLRLPLSALREVDRRGDEREADRPVLSDDDAERAQAPAEVTRARWNDAPRPAVAREAACGDGDGPERAPRVGERHDHRLLPGLHAVGHAAGREDGADREPVATLPAP